MAVSPVMVILRIGTDAEADLRDHGTEAGGVVFAAHGYAACGEEDDVFGHQVHLGYEVAGVGGLDPSVDEGADLLFVRL